MRLWRFVWRRKLRAELRLKEPIFFIMHDVNVNRFEYLWDLFRANAESLHMYEEEAKWVKGYTGERLAVLSQHLESVSSSRQRKQLDFYLEYVGHLFGMLNDLKSKNGLSMQYMYFYSELLLGSTRYLNIKLELLEN